MKTVCFKAIQHYTAIKAQKISRQMTTGFKASQHCAATKAHKISCEMKTTCLKASQHCAAIRGAMGTSLPLHTSYKNCCEIIKK
jgi:hypothetical protein